MLCGTNGRLQSLYEGIRSVRLLERGRHAFIGILTHVCQRLLRESLIINKLHVRKGGVCHYALQ